MTIIETQSKVQSTMPSWSSSSWCSCCYVMPCHATASILHYYHPSSDSLYLPTSLSLFTYPKAHFSFFWLFTFIPWLSTLLLPFHITYYHHPFTEEQFHVSGTDHQQTKPNQRDRDSDDHHYHMLLLLPLPCVCVKNGWIWMVLRWHEGKV